MKMKYVVLVAMIVVSLAANANIVWDWSFASESGQFVTGGNVASPGAYTLLDFSVTASATGGRVGSLTAGDYLTGSYKTDEPFSFNWDGSQVTQWQHSGSNGADWWTFQDNEDSTSFYDFAFDGILGDPTKAAHRDTDFPFAPLASGDVTVSPIPEPSSLVLVSIAGSIGIYIRKRLRN